MSKKSAIVIGAGIVGLATARALAIRGYQVTVIERDHRAVSASIRNFGMIWPIGQPEGALYEQASLARKIWLETAGPAGVWHDQVGSMHVAYHEDERAVLEELATIYHHRGYRLLNPAEVIAKSPATVRPGLLAGLFSPEEMIVNPRQAIGKLPGFLNEKYGVEFVWGVAITEIRYPEALGGGKSFSADEIYVCSGADFETLYPSEFGALPLTRCKLQMLKLKAQPGNWRIGPALCGGLSLLHYHSFKAAGSLARVKSRMEENYKEFLDWGIHVMVSQNEEGELIVGDSHEYGMTHDPFIRSHINEMIISYLKEFAVFKDNTVIENWHGIYPKLTDGRTNIVMKPVKGVTIINGLGGAGMTLSFGLCEQVIAAG